MRQSDPGRVHEPTFWAEVERQIETAGPAELRDFASADTLPFELRPGFEADLWSRLRQLLGS